MKDEQDIIAFRLARADEAFNLAQAAIERQYWNSAASELYYCCFYSVMALFAKHNISASTHSGVKTMFSLHFIKPGSIEVKWGKFFNNLFETRQQGDYGDFMVLKENEIMPLVKEVEEFRLIIKKMLELE